MPNFNRDNRSGGGRGFGRRDSFGGGDRRMGRAQMHDAVCSNCGKECQVPFRPTGEKPVYCRECFAKMNGGESRGNFGRERNERPFNRDNRGGSNNGQDLREINAKLDKILELLNPKPVEPAQPVQEVQEAQEEQTPAEEVKVKKVRKSAKKQEEPASTEA